MKYEDWVKLDYEEAAKLLKDNFEDLKKLVQTSFAMNGGLFIVVVSTLRTVIDEKNKTLPLIITILALILNRWFSVTAKKIKEKTTYLFSKLIEIENNINESQALLGDN